MAKRRDGTAMNGFGLRSAIQGLIPPGFLLNDSLNVFRATRISRQSCS